MADDRKQLLDQADRALQRGDHAGAAALYRKLYNASPSDYNVAQKLGDALARAGQENEAREIFLRLADAWRKEGLRSRSLAALRRATKLGAADLELISRLGQRLVEQGLVADAREPLLEAARLAEGTGDIARGAALFEQVAKLFPRDTGAREALIRLADRGGKPEERAAARLGLSAAHFRNGDTESAVRATVDALVADAGGLSALDAMGEVLAAAEGTRPDAIPERPAGTERCAEAWTVVRARLMQAAGRDAGLGVPLVPLAGRSDLQPRLQLAVARLLLDAGDVATASRALLALEPKIDAHPEIEGGLVDALTALVALNPGDQAAVDLLLRVGMTGGPVGESTGALVDSGPVSAVQDTGARTAAEPAMPAAGGAPSGPLPVEARAKLLEAQALQRQGLSDLARQALSEIPAGQQGHPEVAALRQKLEPAAPVRRPPPPARKAPPKDDLIVIVDEDEDAETEYTRPAVPVEPPARPAAPPPSHAATQPTPIVRGRAPRSPDEVDLASLQQSIHTAVDPGDAETSYQMALGLAEMGLDEQAAPLLERALGDPTRRVDAMVLLARVRGRRGESERAYHEAGLVRDNAQATPPRLLAELVALQAELAIATGRVPEARRFTAELEALMPNHGALGRLRAALSASRS